MANTALDPAPRAAEAAKRRRLLTMSGRFRNALRNVPATNPIWTDIVSQAVLADDRLHSSSRVGTTAVALNQRVIPSSSARARNPRARHWTAVPSIRRATRSRPSALRSAGPTD